MTYPDSVQFLYALGNEIKTAKLGLERIARRARSAGQAAPAPARFVHVAGTNGKGSTCAMIEAGLRAAGRRTGLFTSPHLLEPTERIRIDGEPGHRASSSPPPSTACTAAVEGLLARGRDRAAHHLLRDRHRHGLRALRRGAAWTWWCSRSAWAAAWTPPTW